MEDCIFCKVIKREAPGYIIDENDDMLVILAGEGHPLVVTKKHIPDIYSLDDTNAEAVMKAAVKVSKAVKKSLKCDGVNIVQSNEQAAGQDVFHFHLHVKPRWKDDSVVFSWEHKKLSPEVLQKTQTKIKNALLNS